MNIRNVANAVDCRCDAVFKPNTVVSEFGMLESLRILKLPNYPRIAPYKAPRKPRVPPYQVP